ncbi:MAG TPA: 2-hydroxyacid dehydrogenase [Bacteroidia bacterium]|nr:2-hydroxyacid dehydrogenase [Bacteroidia bacterium]
MKKILFLDSNHPDMIGALRAAGLECVENYQDPEEKILSLIGEFDAVVIRSRFKLTKNFIDAGKKLKCIARAGAGMENIDVTYAQSKGIKCVHAPEGNRDAVGEHAIGMLLSLMNNLNRADREVRDGKWRREENRGHELQGKTVGIIGYGNMGSAFAQRLKGFDVKVIAYDKYKKNFGNDLVKEAQMEEVFTKSDVLSFHLPQTEETTYLLNEEYISRFKKPFWFINTARGKNVNTTALVNGIRSGKILGACLDVLEYESVSFEDLDAKKLPEAFQFLIASDKVILSPHIAGWTFESHRKIAKVLAEKIAEVFRQQ